MKFWKLLPVFFLSCQPVDAPSPAGSERHLGVKVTEATLHHSEPMPYPN